MTTVTFGKFFRPLGQGLLLAIILVVPAQALDESDLANPKIVEAFVDGIVKPLMTEEHSPSGVFAMMKDGKFVFSKGYGWQNVDQGIAADADKTLIRPGSISKLFTWVSVMQLAEQGKLDLDADINRYLKTFQIKDSYPGHPITLRHCMTHTSGFEDGFLGYLIIEDPKMITTLAQAMKQYQPERVNPPGVVGAYSNYCTSLSGLIVANVSGMGFNDYVAKNIFAVLGMENASFEEPLPEAMAQNMAVAYKYAGGQYIARPYELISNFGPAGALAATAENMLRFGSALLNGGQALGGRILQTASLSEMTTDQFSHDKRLKGTGLGFLLYPWGDTNTFGHDGATTAFFSHLGVTPSANLVVFSSFSGPGGSKVNRTLTRAFYREFFAKTQAVDTAATDFNKRANNYAGTFMPWRANFSTIEKLAGLFGQVQVAPDGDGGLLIGGDRYIEIGDRLFRSTQTGDLIAFQENETGNITGYVRDGFSIMAMYKARGYASQAFNFGLLALSVIVFLAVCLRFAYQRDQYRALVPADKNAARAALLAAVSHLWVLVFGVVVAILVGEQFISGIPALFKIWLIFPIVASILSLYLLYQTVSVWNNGLLAGLFARIRYSMVCACAFSLTWMYYFWNILGFKYIG